MTLPLRERTRLAHKRMLGVLKAAESKPRGKTFGMYLPGELSNRMSAAELISARAGTPIERGYWAAVARAAFELMCEEIEAGKSTQPVDDGNDADIA